MIALIFKSITLQQEDMTNNWSKKKEKSGKRAKEKRKTFEVLISEDNHLPSINKSTESKPNEKTLYWGNPFLLPYKNQVTFHLGLPSPLHI